MKNLVSVLFYQFIFDYVNTFYSEESHFVIIPYKYSVILVQICLQFRTIVCCRFPEVYDIFQNKAGRSVCRCI